MQEAVAATHLSKIIEGNEMLQKMVKINDRDICRDKGIDHLKSSFHKFKLDVVLFGIIFFLSVAKDLVSTLEVSTTLGSLTKDSFVGGLSI